jgi:non-heme chloroperoxidase
LTAGRGVDHIGQEDELMPFVTASDDCELFYSDWGEAGARPVVFTHGWGLCGDMWNYQFPDLVEAGRRCIAYDRRGHGRSGRPRGGYDITTLADDLASVIDHLDLRHALLVGHSMGASEVVRYLTRHGSSRVVGIVLSAPTLPALIRTEDNPTGVEAAVFEEARRAMRTDIGAWLSRTPDRDYFGPGQPMAEDLGIWTRQQIAATPLPVLLDCQQAFLEPDFRLELEALDVPALVIQGDADTSAPLELTGRPTAALLAHARLVVIDGAGHGLYASAAPSYNEALLEFVASCRTGADQVA